MKGLLATITMAKMLMILFGLLVIHQDVVEANILMNNTCAYYSGYIANPTSCNGWGFCEGGKLKATGDCGAGLLYDSRKGICNYASKVQCETSPEDICANSEDNTFVAKPNHCSEYCYCENKAIKGCAQCENNQLFNPKESQCVNSYQCPTDSICRLVPNNKFVGSENCGKYLRCLDGSGTEGTCGGSMFFNPITGKCQTNNPCSTTITTTTITLPPNPAKCTSTSTAVQYITDGQTCFGYYTCGNVPAPGLWRPCPYTFQFDSVSKSCVQANQVKCTFDRCANINLKFVTDPASLCKSYYVCTNGKQSATSTPCPPQNPFFDEVNQVCTTVNPGYPICK